RSAGQRRCEQVFLAEVRDELAVGRPEGESRQPSPGNQLCRAGSQVMDVETAFHARRWAGNESDLVSVRRDRGGAAGRKREWRVAVGKLQLEANRRIGLRASAKQVSPAQTAEDQPGRCGSSGPGADVMRPRRRNRWRHNARFRTNTSLAKLRNVSALWQLDLDRIEPSGGHIVFRQLCPQTASGISYHRIKLRIERIGTVAYYDTTR